MKALLSFRFYYHIKIVVSFDINDDSIKSIGNIDDNRVIIGGKNRKVKCFLLLRWKILLDKQGIIINIILCKVIKMIVR